MRTLVNCDVNGGALEIDQTSQYVEYGEEVHVEDNDIADSLLAQDNHWCTPAEWRKRQGGKKPAAEKPANTSEED